MGKRLASVGDEIEEVPLRHQRDELAARRQVREVGDRHRFAGDVPGQAAHFLVRACEERLEDAELVEQFERGRMDGVAAEVAEEVGVLLEHGDVHAGTRQE